MCPIHWNSVFSPCTCRGQCRSQAAEESPERRSLGYCFIYWVLHGDSEQLLGVVACLPNPACLPCSCGRTTTCPWLVATLQADDFKRCLLYFLIVFRIHDILVWIRICGSGSGSSDSCLWLIDPAIFVIDLQDADKKTNWKKKFLLITF